MPLERPYTTIEQVVIETGSSDPELDRVYEFAITQASRFVDRYTHRDFWFHDHTADPFRVPRQWAAGDCFCLPFPVITLTEVRLRGEVLDLGDAVDFEEERRIIYVRKQMEPEEFAHSLTVKGTFGYPLDTTDPDRLPPPTLPDLVKRATTQIAAAWSGELEKEQIALDGTRVSLLETRIPKESKELLKKFRHKVI